MDKRRIPTLNRRWHLAQDEHEMELSDFEYAALRFAAAFNRWNETAARTVSGLQLTATELNLLHVVRMQDRPKGAALIAMLLNRDDHSNIQYALRKLRSLELIHTCAGTSRKGFDYAVTPKGRRLTDDHSHVARDIVYPATRAIEAVDERLVHAAQLLGLMTGIFDEAARVVATFDATPGHD